MRHTINHIISYIKSNKMATKLDKHNTQQANFVGHIKSLNRINFNFNSIKSTIVKNSLTEQIKLLTTNNHFVPPSLKAFFFNLQRAPKDH